MKLTKLILFVFLICSTQTFSQTDHNGEGPFNQLIIRGVMLINGDGSPPRGPVDIVVEDNKIAKVQVVGYPGVAIKESSRPKLKNGGKELDANGMYLLPGFVDMHGHIGGKSQGATPEYVFRLWMAHGITTVRQPSGIDAKELKKLSASNKIVAPRIFDYVGFGSGAKNGINTPEEARAWVRQNAKEGADGIKFFGAEPEIMKAALDENKKLGLGSACHHALLWNIGMVYLKLCLMIELYRTIL